MEAEKSNLTRRSVAIIIACIVLLVLVGYALGYQAQNDANTTIQNTQSTNAATISTAKALSGFQIESIQIVTSENTTNGLVYIARSASQQEQGFQNIPSFGDCNGHSTNASRCIGMMFVFSSSQSLCFWMHNTIMALQQVWISANGTVTGLYQAHPESDASVCHDGMYVLETSPTIPIQIGNKVYQSS